jgi:hypothetical protein
MERRACLVCSLILLLPKIAPFPFPKRDLLEAKEALDLPPRETELLSLLSLLALGSYEVNRATSNPGFFIILPGYGIEDEGVRLIELPKLVFLLTPDTPLSISSPLFQFCGSDESLD